MVVEVVECELKKRAGGLHALPTRSLRRWVLVVRVLELHGGSARERPGRNETKSVLRTGKVLDAVWFGGVGCNRLNWKTLLKGVLNNPARVAGEKHDDRGM